MRFQSRVGNRGFFKISGNIPQVFGISRKLGSAMPVQLLHQTAFEHGGLVAVQRNVIIYIPGNQPVQMRINESGAATKNQNQTKRKADEFFHRIKITPRRAFATQGGDTVYLTVVFGIIAKTKGRFLIDKEKIFIIALARSAILPA